MRGNLYIETILGCGSELQSTHDHGTGRHGSPPSLAQSADECSETTLAIAGPAAQANPVSYICPLELQKFKLQIIIFKLLQLRSKSCGRLEVIVL